MGCGWFSHYGCTRPFDSCRRLAGFQPDKLFGGNQSTVKTMDKTNNNSKPNWLFFVVVIAGIALRLLVATCGHNYDMDSSRIAADIVDRGGNVYAGTERYNYGPIWFHILHALNLLAGHNETAFRYLVTGFLSLVDVGIFSILWRKFGKLAASLFFLNPVSVIITGYDCQFDNCAILLGLLAALLVGDEFDKPISGRKFLGVGCSWNFTGNQTPAVCLSALAGRQTKRNPAKNCSDPDTCFCLHFELRSLLA